MLGDKIKELRKDKNLTQIQLSEKLGIAQSTLGMIESNRRPAGRKTLLKLAEFFNVTIDYLLSEDTTLINNDISLSILGDKIKKLRKEMGMTQQELAKSINVSRSTIGMIEANKQGTSNETLLKLAKVLNTTVENLLSDTDDKKDIPKENKSYKEKEIDTIAAHLEDKNLTPKKVKLLKDYIDALFDDEEW